MDESWLSLSLESTVAIYGSNKTKADKSISKETIQTIVHNDIVNDVTPRMFSFALVYH